jgi:hypothetical protein
MQRTCDETCDEHLIASNVVADEKPRTNGETLLTGRQSPSHAVLSSTVEAILPFSLKRCRIGERAKLLTMFSPTTHVTESHDRRLRSLKRYLFRRPNPFPTSHSSRLHSPQHSIALIHWCEIHPEKLPSSFPPYIRLLITIQEARQPYPPQFPAQEGRQCGDPTAGTREGWARSRSSLDAPLGYGITYRDESGEEQGAGRLGPLCRIPARYLGRRIGVGCTSLLTSRLSCKDYSVS